MNGGSITLSHTAVHGNLQINGGGSFNILPSTTITGNVEIQNIPASAGTILDQICGATVSGNLQVHNNGVPVQIGSSSTACPGNTVTGNLEVHNNTAQTFVFDNHVKGNLQDNNNVTSASVVPATEVVGNVVSGNLQCQSNSSIVDNTNTASPNQCALPGPGGLPPPPPPVLPVR
jgi:hypothetical protein